MTLDQATGIGVGAAPARQGADLLAIQALVSCFDDAVNRRDAGLFASLWTEDAVWEIGPPMPLVAQGHDRIVAAWTEALAGTEWLFRGSFLGAVAVIGDTGTGSWPCLERGAFKSGAGPGGYDNLAVYEDGYRREGSIWRFARRAYRYAWLSTEALPGRPVAEAEG